jgi:hypothetical protein
MYPTLESRDDILKMLDEMTQARQQILERCDRLSPAQLGDPVYPGTWSVLQNLAHLAWAEEWMLAWIQKRPGPLTPQERKVVEKHPELGEKIIAPIDRLEEVRPIVRHCHERYDGAGYPDRLSGEAIPIESRIILVCDAYHAMTTDRPYRKRLPAEEALRRLQEAAGTQFDPRVVEVCARVLVSRGADGYPSALPIPR